MDVHPKIEFGDSGLQSSCEWTLFRMSSEATHRIWPDADLFSRYTFGDFTRSRTLRMRFLNRTIRDVKRRGWRKRLRLSKETHLLMGKRPRENNTLWEILETRRKARILARSEPDRGQTKRMKSCNKRVDERKVLRISKKMEKRK
jgi:hypothetical protein